MYDTKLKRKNENSNVQDMMRKIKQNTKQKKQCK